ncbi:hypothetical protein [Glutamicibacter sp. NPDC090743]|uniref:hypothetical protein n=1 Tax=Glutamicibacter sp. NPDC090743 TaxID=3364001 RepID=UPI003818F894
MCSESAENGEAFLQCVIRTGLTSDDAEVLRSEKGGRVQPAANPLFRLSPQLWVSEIAVIDEEHIQPHIAVV